MNPEIKEQWVRALRSGDYKQGTGCLRTADDRYCCLGVLTDMAVKEGVVQWEQRPDESEANYRVVVDGQVGCFGTLPYEVAEWAGLGNGVESANPRVEYELEIESETVDGRYGLSAVNDHGCNFDTIANLIEEQL